jgi:hypothetical protein
MNNNEKQPEDGDLIIIKFDYDNWVPKKGKVVTSGSGKLICIVETDLEIEYNLLEKFRYEWEYDFIIPQVEIPYFENIKKLNLNKDLNEIILKNIFGEDIIIKKDCVTDLNDNLFYYETSYGFWKRVKYDSKGNEIYMSDANGTLNQYEYDSNDNITYVQYNNGYWRKHEYNVFGDEIYVEDSKGNIVDKR